MHFLKSNSYFVDAFEADAISAEVYRSAPRAPALARGDFLTRPDSCKAVQSAKQTRGVQVRTNRTTRSFFSGASLNTYSFKSPSLTQPSFLQPALISGARMAGRTKQMRISPSQSMPVMASFAPLATSATQPE